MRKSQVTTWEPSNAAIAERYGLRAEDILRFDLNTSPWPSPVLPEVLARPFDPPLNEYPDSYYADLTEAAAAYIGVGVEEILVGAGADEVIDLVAKAFLPPGSTAIVPIPTYSMYGVFTTHRTAKILPVPRLPAEQGFRLDVPAIIAALADASVVWLCNPNNPTGAEDAAADVRAILIAAGELPGPPLVVVDEAYHEFIRASVIGWRAEFPNLLVIRTMSKAFALPGIRVGFGAGDRSIIERLERFRPPGSISTVSAHVATAALGSPAYAAANVEALSNEREWLATELAERRWPSTPSICNFLLVRLGDNDDAEHAADVLLRAGIVPRTFGPANPLRGHLRITVRSRWENERLLAAVERVTAES